MGVIDNEIIRMRTAVYGEEMRDAIGDAMEILDKDCSDVIDSIENVETEVADLKSAFNTDEIKTLLLRANLEDTIETVTFDSSGNPSSVVHTRNGSAVRTDSFVWTANSVTETRTLADGTYITMETNLTTLVTVISDIQEAA